MWAPSTSSPRLMYPAYGTGMEKCTAQFSSLLPWRERVESESRRLPRAPVVAPAGAPATPVWA